MERLRGMFSNADEVQGDSEPPQSANSCSACINLLIHLGKLGIWGTPWLSTATLLKLCFLYLWVSFLLYHLCSFGWGDGISCCSVFSLSFPLELSYLLLFSIIPFPLGYYILLLPYHLSQLLHESQNSTHKNRITETHVLENVKRKIIHTNVLKISNVSLTSSTWELSLVRAAYVVCFGHDD